jgi:hypothetical protein
LTTWAAFFAAEVGAAASLAGLVLAAIAINLSSIIKHLRLPGRAIETLVVLGLYWLLPSVVFCLIAGVMNAWVLLVEIVR